MSVPIFFKQTIERPADATVRQWRTITRGAHQAQADYWVEHYFRRHFSPAADQLYDYRRRTQNYLKRKRAAAARGIAVAGGQLTNVFTGRLRRQLRQTMTTRGFPTRGRITADSTKYAPPRPRTAKQPDKIAEIFRVRPDEARKLGEVLNEGIQSRIETMRAVKTINLR